MQLTRYFLFVLVFSLFSIILHAQTEIKLEEVKYHNGDSVTVKGFIKGIRYLENAVNTPTFINLGAPYPNQLLTIVIWGDDRKKFGLALSEKSVGGLAVVTGKVELYKDKPQIVVRDVNQLKIIVDEVVPDSHVP